TWCGPCRESMPFLSKLQKEFGEQVAFIGVSDERTAIVRRFFEETHHEDVTWDEIITYRIALDDEQATSDSYLRASAQAGIPAAFIVGRDGRIEWIGHPLEIDKPLESVVANTWDREAAKAEYETARAKELAEMMAIQRISRALREGDLEAALAITDELMVEYPEDPRFAMMRLRLLLQAQRATDAKELARELTKKMWDDATSLHHLAWNLATSGESDVLDLALTAAQRVNKLTRDQDPSVLDTLARIFHEQGDLDRAIEWQEKAVNLAGDDAGELADTLDFYRREKQSREEESADSDDKSDAE
ncbi:MAG TPA: redoxin family protein, partial [Pirellulaceae bacterium]